MKTATVYLHGNKENMYSIGEAAGLRGEALSLFIYALSEVKIEINIKENGEYEITKVDDRKLEAL